MNLIIINKLNNSFYNTVSLISSIRELDKNCDIVVISKGIDDETINKFKNNKINVYVYKNLNEILSEIVLLYKEYNISLIKDSCFILENISKIIDNKKISVNSINKISSNKDFIKLVLEEVYKKSNNYIGDDFISTNYYLWKYIISEYNSLVYSKIIDNNENSLLLTLNYNYLSMPNIFHILNNNIYSTVNSEKSAIYNDIDNKNVYKNLYPQQYEYYKDLLLGTVKEKENYNKYIGDKRHIVDAKKEYIRRIQCPYRLENSSCEIINDILGWQHGMDIKDCDSCFNYGISTNTSSVLRENYIRRILNKIINNLKKGSDYDDKVIENIFLKHLSVKEAEDILLKVAPEIGREVSLKIAKKLDEKEDFNQEI